MAASFHGTHRLGDDAHAFPLAGLLAGAAPALALLAGGTLGLSPAVSATLALGLLVALTGALHEDGLADVADGLFGHHGRERALAIMKDSRIGAYGTLALVLSVALRIALLADLATAAPALAALALLGAAAASRGAMALFWASLPSADPGGLADSVGQPSRNRGLQGAVLGALLLGLAALPAGASGIAGALLGLGLTAALLSLFARFLLRRLGGQTGDGLGAAQQIGETACLLGLAIMV
ncbi:hypothetical protein ASG48_13970 [Aurantimonas sp. Leaf443]|nr:hypothetical protein ASG48_13970 [Aurantimonas sp. Leaf443]